MSDKQIVDEADNVSISFLSHCRQNNISALVVYAFMGADGKPVMRVKSNQPDGPTQGILDLLSGTDSAAVEAGARALLGDKWAQVTQADQETARTIASIILKAARTSLQERTRISTPGNSDADGGSPLV